MKKRKGKAKPIRFHDFFYLTPIKKMGNQTWWHCPLCPLKIIDFGNSKSARRIRVHVETHSGSAPVTHATPHPPQKKIKITAEGQQCRHCGTPVVRQVHKGPPKPTRSGYYFEYWFKCPRCKALYMVEAAKRFFDPQRAEAEAAKHTKPAVAPGQSWKPGCSRCGTRSDELIFIDKNTRYCPSCMEVI